MAITPVLFEPIERAIHWYPQIRRGHVSRAWKCVSKFLKFDMKLLQKPELFGLTVNEVFLYTLLGFRKHTSLLWSNFLHWLSSVGKCVLISRPLTDLTRRGFLMFLTSRSGMFLSLLLGCSPLTLADTPPGHNEDTPGRLWDDCDYASGEYWRCGDICIYGDGLCECGNTTLGYKQVLRYHCCTSTSGDTVSCPGGQVRDISEPCEDGRCYGDYISSEYLSYDTSHYSCSGVQKECLCLPLPEMCKGLSSCGET